MLFINIFKNIHVQKNIKGSIILEVVLAMSLGLMASAAASDILLLFRENNIKANARRDIISFVDNEFALARKATSEWINGFSSSSDYTAGTYEVGKSVIPVSNSSSILSILVKDQKTAVTYYREELFINKNSALEEGICDIDFSKVKKWQKVFAPALPAGSYATGVDVRGDVAVIGVDSATASKSDIYLYRMSSSSLEILSELNTGPGVNSVHLSGNNIFIANSGSSGQFQIASFDSSMNLSLKSQYKIASATSSYPKGVFVYYDKNKVYLGTTKSTCSPELLEFDVSDTYNPRLINSYNTDTQINSILTINDYVLLATPQNPQLHVLREYASGSTSSFSEENSFNPSGYSVQAGNTLVRSRENILFGRAVGGFNNVNNHEIFVLDAKVLPNISVNYSEDTGSSVYGFSFFGSSTVYATGLHSPGVYMMGSDNVNALPNISFNTPITDMKCAHNKLLITFKSTDGLAVLIPEYYD